MVAYGAGVRGPVDDDDIEELEFSVRKPEDHRRAAATLLAWADEEHPDDEAEPARLLNAAAWHLEQVGERDTALGLYRRSVAARGTVLPDARCYLHAALLRAGLVDEARQLADEVRREAPADLDVYVFMSENHEMAGDLRQAHRWLNIGLRTLELPDPMDVPPDSGHSGYVLLRSRRRVRAALGLPPDDVDDLVPPLELPDEE
ncbi:hypothetical protein SAMN05216574_10467 [Blastococcus tunisiensis]|uniref:Tetratricopeptide repeat-containing protein n=1 Tax=Blastococcus tunisiensis TaxID=1798228 RepID=A0A1I2B696_9ACTN|nr:hypothetical protein SAMN05216574_10467 [Blastococcus sp. DSM 46838]